MPWRTTRAYNPARLLLVGIVWCGVSAPGSAMAKPSHHQLPSGVRVVVDVQRAATEVAVHAAWSGGSRRETPANSGVGSLLARTITGGCGARDANAVKRHVAGLGGAMTGTSGRNTFALRARWPKATWRRGLRAVGDCVLRPRFEPGTFRRAKRRHRAAIRRSTADGVPTALRLLLRTLYRTHPYRLDPLGDAAVVAALNPRAVRAHYRTHFPLSRLTVVVVGPVRARDVVDELGRVLNGTAKAAGAPPAPPAEQFRTSRGAATEVYQYRTRPNDELVVGFPGATFLSRDRPALDVLAALLGGPRGLLTTAGRGTGGLLHPVRFRSVPGLEPGYLVAHATCDPSRTSAVLAAMRQRMAQLASQQVDAAALARAKRGLLRVHAASRRDVASIAAGLAFHEVHGLDAARYLRYPDAVRAVTAADVQRVAATYLAWPRSVTATVTARSMTPGAARRVRGIRKRLPRRRHRSRRARHR